MVDEQSRQAAEIRDLKAERDRLKAEKEQLEAQTGISNLSMVAGPSGICQNCTRLRAENNQLVREHNTLKWTNGRSTRLRMKPYCFCKNRDFT